MKSVRNSPVWLMSFVDLCLVLLGFFVMLHAMSQNQRELVRGLRSSFGDEGSHHVVRHDLAPATLFQKGEAMFRPGEYEKLRAIGAEAASSRARVRVESIGTDPATNRFDGWELAAARTAAAARAIQSGGLDADAISIAIPEMKGQTPASRQKIGIEIEAEAQTPQ